MVFAGKEIVMGIVNIKENIMAKKMKIAIITARGGSKRIPKKNIKPFCGKPIIAYSIEAALESGIFDEVMVSTDSEEIAKVAEQYGASVPFMRSKEASNDWAITADVLREVIINYSALGKRFESFCCIYPTAPFISAEKLKRAKDILEYEQADSLIPVVKFSFPPQRGLIIKGRHVEYKYPEFETFRSQDLEPMYHDCGQFYFCNTEAFLKYHTMITPNTVAMEMPEEEVQDIDSQSDWELAEIKYKIMMQIV